MKFSTGYNLMELMIALTLGLIFTQVVLQIFLQSRGSYQLANDVTRLNDDTRFLQVHLERVIQQAGYRSLPPANLQAGFIKISDLYSDSPFIEATSQTGWQNSDTLTIRYQGDLAPEQGIAIYDCLGRAVEPDVIVENTFFLNESHQLICSTKRIDSAESISAPLIDQVEQFKILLAETLDDSHQIGRFVSPNYPFLDFSRVVGVRVGILLKSQHPSRTDPDTRTYDVLGYPMAPDEERYWKRLIILTVGLPNLSIGSQ